MLRSYWGKWKLENTQRNIYRDKKKVFKLRDKEDNITKNRGGILKITNSSYELYKSPLTQGDDKT